MFLFPYFCHEDLAQMRTILSEKSIGSGTGATNDVVNGPWAESQLSEVCLSESDSSAERCKFVS